MSKSNVDLTFHVDAARAIKLLKLVASKTARFGFIIWSTKEGVFVSDTITVKDTDPPVHARASFADVEGATADVTTVWEVDDENVAVVTVDPDDDQHITIEPGSPGASVVHCTGTNEDGTSVELVGTFTVLPSDAVVGKLDFQPGT